MPRGRDVYRLVELDEAVKMVLSAPAGASSPSRNAAVSRAQPEGVTLDHKGVTLDLAHFFGVVFVVCARWRRGIYH